MFLVQRASPGNTSWDSSSCTFHLSRFMNIYRNNCTSSRVRLKRALVEECIADYAQAYKCETDRCDNYSFRTRRCKSSRRRTGRRQEKPTRRRREKDRERDREFCKTAIISSRSTSGWLSGSNDGLKHRK